jgi:hypothetical protein
MTISLPVIHRARRGPNQGLTFLVVAIDPCSVYTCLRADAFHG